MALSIGLGFVALACRAHVGTPASASRDDDAGGEGTWGLAGIDAGPPEPEAVGGDGDGIPDFKDACPSEPEDLDNFEDQDGCPDPDNDRDGIPDVSDKCPNEPETYNGVQDADGCPDPSRVACCREARLTKALILFDDDSAAIRPSTAAVLDTIVAYLLDDLQDRNTKITLEGHAEASERHPTALAAARTAAVRRYLVNHGVPSRVFKPARHVNGPARKMLGDELDGAPNRRCVDLRLLGG